MALFYDDRIPMSQFWVMRWNDGTRELMEYPPNGYMHNWSRHVGYCVHHRPL